MIFIHDLISRREIQVTSMDSIFLNPAPGSISIHAPVADFSGSHSYNVWLGPDLLDYVEGFLTGDSPSVAALVFLVYDILLTVNEECLGRGDMAVGLHEAPSSLFIILFRRPWSIMKVCYYFVRYMPMLFQIPLLFVGSELSAQFHFTTQACFMWQIYQGVASMLTNVAVDYILISRVHAFYLHSRSIRWIVNISYVLEICAMCVGLGLALPGIQFDSICIVDNIPDILVVYFAGVILFQTLLFVLTAFKFIRSLRSGWGQVPIIALLMRDGTWAFFILLAFLVCNPSLYQSTNHSFAGLLYTWLLSIYSYCQWNQRYIPGTTRHDLELGDTEYSITLPALRYSSSFQPVRGALENPMQRSVFTPSHCSNALDSTRMSPKHVLQVSPGLKSRHLAAACS
ncbi:hypothetical protein D9757_007674 [Collybiopsis confluens]|uniref:DUF6533 domain-containing protein n=1 Tax=Collybiopsis confluens TaxID=2823264 RepID=A0A8H5M3G5_9AGAR|nr:hypothetical protein D9757_007674 [Collybiopsis confluens]